MKKRYLALLRAISNVSMNTFRKKMEELGFTAVESDGMSGNLLFNAKGKDIKRFEQRITNEFGTPAMVLTDSQVSRVVNQDPFGSSIYFLTRSPTTAKRKAFLKLDFRTPPPVIRGKTIYFVHPTRLRGKRGSFDFERGLEVLGTARSARVARQILARMKK